jgi:hypothetical protein
LAAAVVASSFDGSPVQFRATSGSGQVATSGATTWT